MRRWSLAAIVLSLAMMSASCALAPTGFTSPDTQTLTLSPAQASVRVGSAQPFAPSLTGKSWTWSVNGIAGGNATLGTVDASGNYSAPAVLPTPNTITVTAAETAKPSQTASSAVTLLNPIPVVTGISPSQVNVGTFTLTISGSEFVNGATVSFGGTALTTSFVSNTQLTASGTAAPAQVGAVTVEVMNPDPGAIGSNNMNAEVVGTISVAANVADRFLEQTTFGPTTALITQVQYSGLQGFLTAQYALPITKYPLPASGESGLGAVQQKFFVQNLTAQDQLRQRVAFALSQIFVIGGAKVTDSTGYTNYLQLLENDAFTNYRQIMQDATLSPAMGDWLDMVNNGKPNTSQGDHANENYAREFMQLFTIGTAQLNLDGSYQLDSGGNQIPTYTQNTVEAFALAYTGWTYPLAPGTTQKTYNPAYWTGPMVAVDSNHDTTAKQLLVYPGVSGGGMLPAGQSAAQDLQGALDNVFNHPNLGPFVSSELIQHLVTSNPSPAYIERVASVFNDNGSGVRGDMKALITAILMDPEARRGDDPASAVGTDGHLQEPILYMTGLLRAFGAASDGTNLAYYGSGMGQEALYAPSVFNFYSPSYVIPGTTMYGPEFQILTTATSLNRVNWVNSYVFGSIGSGTTVSFSNYATQASNPSALLGSLNTLMLHGSMASDMQSAILTAMQAVPAGSKQGLQQAQMAIYLIGTSSQYQVQH
ncbi:MAG TPA: DUF1800 family protein [Candidatus Acidoferrales bacterium]|nr:DUF1800 family protein [Candidatus Acidoferrales bacterium]